jgi:hypothetical protein
VQLVGEFRQVAQYRPLSHRNALGIPAIVNEGQVPEKPVYGALDARRLDANSGAISDAAIRWVLLCLFQFRPVIC